MLVSHFEFVIKIIGGMLTFPVISFIFNFYYIRAKDRIINVEKLSAAIKSDSKDCHLIEVLFRVIYKSRYVSADEIKILMAQKSPSRLSFLYAQLNKWLKVTELNNKGGDITIEFSHSLRTKKLQNLWGYGLLFSSVLIYAVSLYFGCKAIDLSFLVYNRSHVNPADVFLYYSIFISFFALYNYPFLLGSCILLAPLRIKIIHKIISARND
ncbi:hypothetical protein DT73_04515 [Mangrovibacter sp. MFB070]|uniref:hypothetical protein n=1 Tax=Mangrovibacter sp. MFB070 TaxID=1224318 RepID=UPI0004D6713B|nr:hypothetical protein [Mangrovibacter sp. MFB070]KEA53917.1 hypothetical protein DT73_04515 [Mangrovibacter sp. MFB070]